MNMPIPKLISYVFFLALILVSCSTTTTPTPTVTQSLSDTIIITRSTATRPSATPTPLPTNTQLSTATPTATLRPTSTPRPPTYTPTPLPTPDPNLVIVATNIEHRAFSINDHVTMSSQGQLAYISDWVLFVETTPGSKQYEEIGASVATAAWSPDGRMLVYSLVQTIEETEQHQQYLYTPETNTHIPLAQLIPNYPNPPYQVQEAYWTPDSTKILFMSLIDERHEPIPGMSFNYVLAVADLNQRTFTDNKVIPSLEQPVWLTNDRYILRYHCGSPCAFFTAYDYTGQEAWSLPWDTGGFVTFAPELNLMINAGRMALTPADLQTSTIDIINMTSGEVGILWEINSNGQDYFIPFYPPLISPNEQYLSFNYGYSSPYTSRSGNLYIIDRDGKEIGLYANSYAQDWRPSGGLVITDILETGEHRLHYLPLDGTIETFFITSADTEIVGDERRLNSRGKWSPDGRYFIFATHNRERDIETVYLWQPDMGDPTPIHVTGQNHEISNFLWSPDSQNVYFIVNGSSSQLYLYTITD